jgi:hypothetical protein
MDRRLGPLNMNVAGETTSRLGADPYIEEPGLDPKLDARDLASGLALVTSRS